MTSGPWLRASPKNPAASLIPRMRLCFAQFFYDRPDEPPRAFLELKKEGRKEPG